VPRFDDLDALAAWADANGGLLDGAHWVALASADHGGVQLELATPLPTAVPRDPRDAVSRPTRPARRWTLAPVGGGPPPDIDVLALPAEIGGLWPTDGSRAALAFDLGVAIIELQASAWEVTLGDVVALPIVRRADPLSLAWYGSGPVASDALRAACAAQGYAVALSHNWVGSGQRSPALLPAGPPSSVASGAVLADGCWRVHPSDAAPADPRGVWLIGSTADDATPRATVIRSAASAPALVAAVARALATLPGLDFAASGNVPVEDGDALSGWLDGLTGD